MARFLITVLGSSKQNCDWHIFTVSILRERTRKVFCVFIFAFKVQQLIFMQY